MEAERRHGISVVIWILLAICLLIDGGLGEVAISGCCDVGFVKDGNWAMPEAKPELWFPAFVFVLAQGAMIAALIHLRPEPPAAPSIRP